MKHVLIHANIIQPEQAKHVVNYDTHVVLNYR